MIVDAVLGTKGAILYADADVVLATLAIVYATFKINYQARMGVPLDGKVWRWVDVVLETAKNFPGAVNKALVASGRSPILPHPDVVAAEARADAAEAQVATQGRASMLVAPAPVRRIDTLPGVTPPPAE